MAIISVKDRTNNLYHIMAIYTHKERHFESIGETHDGR